MSQKCTYPFGKQEFINPYNFVPVTWKNKEINKAFLSAEKDKGNLISGVLQCSLYTRTPIAIPDTEKMTCDENQHKTYPFMKNPEGQYMIPGSSIRGAIRSVYETVTDSCFITSKVDQRITKRTAFSEATLFEPSLLVYNQKKNGWEIYKANRHLIIIDEKGKKPRYDRYARLYGYQGHVRWKQKDLNIHPYGKQLSFTSGQKFSKNNKLIGYVVKKIGTGKKTGYLYKGEVPDPIVDKMRSKKHFESIFEEIPMEPISITDDEVEALKYTLKEYNNPAVNRCLNENRENYYKELWELIVAKVPDKRIPVWCKYGKGKKPNQLSAACIGRVTFQNKMGDLLFDKVPCKIKNRLCKACGLFGTAKDEAACSGKIRVTDAVLKEPVPESSIGDVNLKELSSPKLSYLQFYIDKNNSCKDWSYDQRGITLKGRKYYWHNTEKDIYKASKQTNRNATMELINEKQTFGFDLYFDNITNNQLEELKWVITLGNNNKEDKYCYKIGHGKPIGLGSVKLLIDAIEIRSFSMTNGTWQYITNRKPAPNKVINRPSTFYNESTIDAMCKIMDIENTAGKKISYPFIDNAKEDDNKTAAHQWFSTNKGKDKNKYQEWRPINTAVEKPFRTYKLVKEEVEDN